jgi:hypothetical protein
MLEAWRVHGSFDGVATALQLNRRRVPERFREIRDKLGVGNNDAAVATLQERAASTASVNKPTTAATASRRGNPGTACNAKQSRSFIARSPSR